MLLNNHTSKLTLRPFAEGDEDGIINLILPIQREEFSIPITAEQQPDLRQIETFYQKGKGNFWVALHEYEIVGTVALIDIGNSAVALRKMFVKKEFRGKEFGVAQQLMDTVFKWCKANETKTILLGTIEPFKAAQKFYEKNGFVKVNVEDLPESFPRMKVDNIFYRYTFES